MTDRPSFIELTAHFGCPIQAEKYLWGYDQGLKHGQRQAQRHFQLSLGLVQPTPEEAAFWHNPVPLKEGGEDALDRIKQVPETDNYPDLPVEDEGTITVGKLKAVTHEYYW
tara:strand:+ start:372 stop:704 length:333 start_codon:yes stop_codon:yes gene_type:complete